MVREGLGKLARLTGHRVLDAFFSVTLEGVMDLEEMETRRIRRHVYLARYGKQSMLQWEDVDGATVRKYARALSDFLMEENDLAKKSSTRTEG